MLSSNEEPCPCHQQAFGGGRQRPGATGTASQFLRAPQCRMGRSHHESRRRRFQKRLTSIRRRYRWRYRSIVTVATFRRYFAAGSWCALRRGRTSALPAALAACTRADSVPCAICTEEREPHKSFPDPPRIATTHPELTTLPPSLSTAVGATEIPPTTKRCYSPRHLRSAQNSASRVAQCRSPQALRPPK